MVKYDKGKTLPYRRNKFYFRKEKVLQVVVKKERKVES